MNKIELTYEDFETYLPQYDFDEKQIQFFKETFEIIMHNRDTSKVTCFADRPGIGKSTLIKAFMHCCIGYDAFKGQYEPIGLISSTLGVGMEDQGGSVTNSIASAIQALNNISLEEGIIAQFTNLKTAIDSVSSAISGGGGESSGGENQGANSGSTPQGGESGEKGESGGGSSLTGAIETMGENAKKIIGEPDAEGDGTVIGEFGSLETAVTDVTAAIGGGESEGDNDQGNGEEGSDNLVGSIVNLGETAKATLGEPDGDGVIGRFGEFEDVIAEANEQVTGI